MVPYLLYGVLYHSSTDTLPFNEQHETIQTHEHHILVHHAPLVLLHLPYLARWLQYLGILRVIFHRLCTGNSLYMSLHRHVCQLAKGAATDLYCYLLSQSTVGNYNRSDLWCGFDAVGVPGEFDESVGRHST